MKRRLLSLFLLLLLLLLPACEKEPHPGPADHIFSHRGASGEATEHTRAAYDLALSYGSRWLEQDLVLSANGTLYVSHDLTPERLTGEPRPFSELTDTEIDALRTADGQSILKLEEVFSAYRKKTGFVVEVRGMEQLEPLFALIEKYDVADRLILQAWNTPELEAVRERFPTVRRLLLVTGQNGVDWACVQDSVDIVAIKSPLMTEFNCAWIHQHGKEVCVFTLNWEDEIRRAIALNVDYYFTDYTARAMELEKERVQPTNPESETEG